MKIKIFTIAATISLAIVYALVLRIQPDRPEYLARFIPSVALVYLEQENFFDTFVSFSGSSLGKKIESIDFAGVAKDIGAGEGAIVTMHNLVKIITTAKSDPFLKELFGNRIALAILPPINYTRAPHERRDFFLENSVVVAEPSYPESVFEMLGSLLPGALEGATITNVQYGKHHIKRIEYKGNSFSMVRIDRIYLSAMNERQLRRCIDVFDDAQPAFANNKEFLTLKTRFPEADRLLILPFDNLKEYLPKLLAEFDLSSNSLLKEESLLPTFFRDFGYAAKHQQSIIKDWILLRYDHDKKDEFTKQPSFRKPVTPKHFWFSLTTENPMLYLWTNIFNLKSLLFSISEDRQQPGSPTGSISQLISGVGKSFDPIPETLGEEMAIIVEPGSEDRPLRVPLALAFLPVTNSDGLKKAIQDIVDTHSIVVKTVQHGNVVYMQSPQSPQDGLLPLYGFLGEHFFLGNSASLLHKVIDAHESGSSSLQGDLLKEDDTVLAEPNNLIAFSSNPQLIDTLKDFLSIMGTLVALEDRQLAQKIKLINDAIIGPLLDEMKMYDTSIFRSYLISEHVVVDVTTTISAHP
ncbi:MAG: hypothetical protein OEL83_11900 [Desulforhopalus sp.]|nr:hypothetical protein [Desulforhopalus sp.]